LSSAAGLADAATGGTLILGKANKESSTAPLSRSKEAPLSLVAGSDTAPLAVNRLVVNRKVMVKNLNASYVTGSAPRS
jgi:hypothetical protein